LVSCPELRTLRLFKKRVLKRIYGSKREALIEERRKYHNGELHGLYFSPVFLGSSRNIREVEHTSSVGGDVKYIQDFRWKT